MIELSNVSFSYQNKHIPLFSNISTKVPNNTICGLLGKNGAGKTTLIKLMTGLIFPDHGQCTINGLIMRERSPRALSIYYFVAEECVLPSLTGQQYLKLYAPFYPTFNHEIFQNCLEVFGIQKNQLLTHYSLGEKKKFQISFALATCCPVLFFDEPTNGLDILSKGQFRQLLAAHMSDQRLFIISTHQVHDVEQLTDHIVVVDEGQIVLNISTEKIAKKITVKQTQEQPNPGHCLYSEKHSQGYSVVVACDGVDNASIDLELFFKMVIANKNRMSELFGE